MTRPKKTDVDFQKIERAKRKASRTARRVWDEVHVLQERALLAYGWKRISQDDPRGWGAQYVRPGMKGCGYPIGMAYQVLVGKAEARMLGDLRDVDEAVKRAVFAGKNRLPLIAAHTTLGDRVVDRALQRLRRRGVLAFQAGDGWTSAAEVHRG